MIDESQKADLGVIVRSQFSPYQNMSLSELRNSSGYPNFMKEVANMYTNGKRANYIRGKAHLGGILGYSEHTIDNVLKDAKEEGFDVKPQKMDVDRIQKLVNDYNNKPDMSVKQLANEYGISTGYLYKILKKQEEAGQTVNYRRKKAEANSQSLEQTMEDAGAGLPFRTINIGPYMAGPLHGKSWLRKTGKFITAALIGLTVATVISAGSYLMGKHDGKHDGGVWKEQAMEFLADSNKLIYEKLQLKEEVESLEGQVKNRQATDEARMNARVARRAEGEKVHTLISHDAFGLPSDLARVIVDTKTGVIQSIVALQYNPPSNWETKRDIEEAANAVWRLAGPYLPFDNPQAFEEFTEEVGGDKNFAEQLEKDTAVLGTSSNIHTTPLDVLFTTGVLYANSFQGNTPGAFKGKVALKGQTVWLGSLDAIITHLRQRETGW